MDLSEVTRRNRLWMVLIAVLSGLDYWVAVTAVAAVCFWGLSSSGDNYPFSFGQDIGFGILVATPIVAVTMARQLRRFRPRTIERLGAVPIGHDDFPLVINVLAELAVATGNPPIAAALLADPAPNALAVGGRRAATTVVVTSGLVEQLTRAELRAVLAVEVCAIRRLDVALESVAVAATGRSILMHHSFRTMVRDPRAWILIVFTWPSMALGELLRRWSLREIGFGADEMAIAATRDPSALRRALVKLRDNCDVVAMLDYGSAPLWFEPIPHEDAERAREFRRFAVTPPLSERIGRIPAHAGG